MRLAQLAEPTARRNVRFAPSVSPPAPSARGSSKTCF
ncbi:hypothetical protein A2U01_0096769 [Trifolium medium]|uniref:Uncharacterized protein n=1 Tax=Trifolium medium TaxID=97028 RepID=A0A392UT37_9FABA|nr:hypothetical protein [Trifolium medium]